MRLAHVVLAATIVLTGCQKSSVTDADPSPPVAAGQAASQKSRPRAEPADLTPIARSINTFAFKLFEHAAPQGENAFISPLSISTALAMTWAGARGQTAEEMKRTLAFDLEPAELHRINGALLTSLNASDGERGYTLRVVNRLWGQRGMKLEDAFLETTRGNYEAPLELVDFTNEPDAARETINEWVEKRTERRIKELLARKDVSRRTRLVLTNAVYFKGLWDSEFDAGDTRSASFTTATGKTRKVRMMRQSAKLEYAETESMQVLELPYRSGDFAMVVLLPREATGLTALEGSLSATRLDEILGQLRSQKVEVELPRFRLERSYDLTGPLKRMGMPTALDEAMADFSGIAAQSLSISKVVHKAFVEVNEEGSEAAAATAVVTTVPRSIQRAPPVFRADRPFLFLIRNQRSGALLFMGRLADPA